MNENVNLSKILRDCLKGTKLYSPLFGVVKFEEILEDWNFVRVRKGKNIWTFTYDAKFLFGISNSKSAEIMLFPSKEQRDWTKFRFKKPKFDPMTFKPYDKVLVRDGNSDNWKNQFFSYIIESVTCHPCFCINNVYTYCIPYNDDTKHLVGTKEEAPEFYRYWEE